MKCPSGDQCGAPASPRRDVNCPQLVPSLAHAQISEYPDRSDANAIFFPSEEKSGPTFLHFAEITVVAGPCTCVRSRRRTRQMLSLESRCKYARSPFREIEGSEANTTPVTGKGVPPEAGMRHKLWSPLREEENTISRPSGVHAEGPYIGLLSKVKRLIAPPAAGTTNRSAAIPTTLPRMNATIAPSGEKTGAKS